MKLLLDYGTTRIRASVEKDGILYPVEFPEGRFLGSVVNLDPQGNIEFSSFASTKHGVKSFVGLKQRLLKSAFFRSNEIDAFLEKTELFLSKRIDTRSHFYVVDGELVAGDAPLNASPDDFAKRTQVSLEKRRKPTVISFGPLGESEYIIARHSLQELKNIIQESIDLSQLEELVVGIPVSPSKAYLDLIKELSDRVRFVYEPLAAVFGAKKQIKEGTHCVIDFGGGTIDLVLFSYSKGVERVIDRLQLNYGGVDIDEGILEYLKNKQTKEYQRYFDNRMLNTIRSLKERLSYEEEVEDFFLDEETGKLISLNMKRAEFEDFILSKSMKSVFEDIENFIRSIETEKIDSLLVCGGSSVIPFFQKNLEKIIGELFKLTPDFNDDAFLVSKGLSLASKYSIIGNRICVVDPQRGKTAILYDVSDIPEKRYFIIHNPAGKDKEIRLDFCSQDISEPLESFSVPLSSVETFATISLNENQDLSLELDKTSAKVLDNPACGVGDEENSRLICKINHKPLKTSIPQTCTLSPNLVDIFSIPTDEKTISQFNSGKISPSRVKTPEPSCYEYFLEFDREITNSEDLMTSQVLVLILANIDSELSRVFALSERLTSKKRGDSN
ncbi:MAG: Hsp70 family protein [Thermotogaceae bacterium]|nr:Hsp70 family protein [Thermotogaceae bacterium]